MAKPTEHTDTLDPPGDFAPPGQVTVIRPVFLPLNFAILAAIALTGAAATRMGDGRSPADRGWAPVAVALAAAALVADRPRVTIHDLGMEIRNRTGPTTFAPWEDIEAFGLLPGAFGVCHAAVRLDGHTTRCHALRHALIFSPAEKAARGMISSGHGVLVGRSRGGRIHLDWLEETERVPRWRRQLPTR